ncbi:MAG: hypothetical protein KDD83_00565 [Caldilineaceae bacterium]|nr:hypothetical protein [Caldilineaceae bacterium]
MFDKFFKRQPQNSLEQISVDELRTARVKLERTRDRLMVDIRKLEQAKSDYFTDGAAQPDRRSKRMAAQRIKEAEEQIQQLDQQLRYCDKQLQIINRFEFLKRNQAQMVELGIDELLGKMETGDLRKYIDEVNLSGAVNVDRLNELSDMLGEVMSAGFSDEDPEIARLMEEMELAALAKSDDEFQADALLAEPSDEDEEPPLRERRTL